MWASRGLEKPYVSFGEHYKEQWKSSWISGNVFSRSRYVLVCGRDSKVRVLCQPSPGPESQWPHLPANWRGAAGSQAFLFQNVNNCLGKMMKSFLTKMLVEETRGQRAFIRGETVLVNIVISEFYEPHSLTEQEKDFIHCPNLSKSSRSSCDKNE